MKLLKKLIERKKSKRIHPDHITKVELLKEMAKFTPEEVKEMKEEMNKMYRAGELITGNTLNDIWFRIKL